MVEQVVSGLITFLLGGGLIAWLNHRREGKTHDRSLAEQELEKHAKLILEKDVQIRFLESRSYEAPIIAWKQINGKFTWVSNYCIIKLLEPLGITMNMVIGKTIPEVFAEHKDFLASIVKLQILARKDGQAAMKIHVPGLGDYLTFKCHYYQPQVGVIYQCEMLPSTIIHEV